MYNASWDYLTALENWTEHGVDPAQREVTTDLVGVPGRTRPLCLYPSWPKYRGTGDVNNATSFARPNDLNIRVICQFADGGRQAIGDQYVDLREAVGVALEFADLHGRDQHHENDAPTCFDVLVNETLELSVAVISGDLTDR